ncbi:GNAT family N-acetyltransferase [Streptomyces rubrolavendulae]|uniref:Mycothiol acetyltransferase n=1 Tax=Streptomyces rubrolavendulae TaxID=285473 RepID=A0A1D8FY78_9ACTN|nr:GNAT family N-acetyltransferase [Streptomyces rubrolavendulae]AOT58160.1 Mycothiol acetyltransferase [Streptomyces rubrolavendulae]
MTVIVREFVPDDAPAAVRVRRSAAPYTVTTPASMLNERRAAPPARRYLMLVAERDGEVVGYGNAGLVHEAPEPGQAFVTPVVDPAHRGHGVGGLLLRAAEEHLAALGAREVYAWVRDEPECLEFARTRGYRSTRTLRYLRLDLASAALPEPPAALPPGVELRTAADFAADPRPLFAADSEATADEPTDIPFGLGDYEEWLADTWEDPLLDRELTVVALVDGAVAAFSAAHTDGEGRYVSAMTGTVRAHRGRGLATLAKTESLRRARAAGCMEAYTSNDSANGPMLAINRRLGYEPCATEVRHVRSLG